MNYLKMYEGFTEAELSGRFEAESTFIYAGDTVVESLERKPGADRTGTVRSIYHGLMSPLNRDYLIADMDEDFDAYLCKLDLVKRGPESQRRLSRGMPIYIDDAVEVADPSSQKYRVRGNVRALALHEGKVLLEIRDWNFDEEMRKTLGEFYRPVQEEIDRRVEEGFEGFKEMLANEYTDAALQLHSDSEWRKIYSMRVARDVHSSSPYMEDYNKKSQELNASTTFRIGEDGVVLLEQFPPNRMWKV